VIVRAKVRASRARGSSTRYLVAAAGLFLFPAAAHAQVGATVSAFSDLRFRGYSLSEGSPVAVLDFAYDDPSGLYAGGAATGVLREGGEPAPLALQLNAGYARLLRSGTTLEAGITGSTYSSYSGGHGRTSYTEVYAGVARGALSARIFLSPHYFERGRWTAYGEVNANVSPARHWSIDGHAGMLVPLRTPTSAESYRAQFDWRVGVSREIGRVSLHAAWTDGTPGRDFYRGRTRSRSAIVLGASLVL
jgi:uncharacterized protein (TIGR02001 family)